MMIDAAQEPRVNVSRHVSGRALDNRWASLKIHAMVVAIVTILFTLIENPSVTLIVGGLLCAPTYFVLGLIEGKRSVFWFNPLSYYFFWYSVGLGLSAIHVGVATISGDSLPFSVVLISPESLAKAYVIYLLGSVAFHAGLECFRPKRSTDLLPHNIAAANGRLWSLIAMWAIGLWSGWNPALLAPLGAPGKILPWLSLGALSAFAITPRATFGLSRLSFIVILIIGTSGQFSANLMSFSKTYLMFSFFPLLWFFVIQKTLRPWLPLLGLALAIFYLTIVAPLVTIARQVPIQEGETQIARLIKTFQGEVPVHTDYVYEMSYLDRIIAVLDRQFDPYPVGFFVEEVEWNGLQLGTTMDYITYAFIPRLFWPDKPNVTRGAWFAAYTGFAPSEDESTTSLGITPTGELYWNFGVLGTVMGMFVIGGLLALLWQMAGTDPLRHPARMVLYLIVTLGLPYIAEAVTLLVAIVLYFIVFKILFATIRVIAQARNKTRLAIA